MVTKPEFPVQISTDNTRFRRGAYCDCCQLGAFNQGESEPFQRVRDQREALAMPRRWVLHRWGFAREAGGHH